MGKGGHGACTPCLRVYAVKGPKVRTRAARAAARRTGPYLDVERQGDVQVADRLMHQASGGSGLLHERQSSARLLGRVAYLERERRALHSDAGHKVSFKQIVLKRIGEE